MEAAQNGYLTTPERRAAFLATILNDGGRAMARPRKTEIASVAGRLSCPKSSSVSGSGSGA